jgi:hypothetical protein
MIIFTKAVPQRATPSPPDVSLASGTCEALYYSARAKFSEARYRRNRQFAHAQERVRE